MEWLESTAMGRQSAVSLNQSDERRGARTGSSEGPSGTGSIDGVDPTDGPRDESMGGYEDDDTPLTWAEVWIMYRPDVSTSVAVSDSNPVRRLTV